MACFFPHSPTHRWSRRSRRKCNPPTIRFSWCLVELELKYTSKAPDTVGYIRRMRSIDFLELQALRKKLILCGGPHQKRKKKKNTLPSQNCWRLKVKYESCSSRHMNTFLPKPSKSFTLRESLQLPKPFLWRSVHHSSTVTSNWTLYLGIRLSFCSWWGNFNESSAHGLNEVSNLFYDEKRRTISKVTLLWLKPKAQIFILSRKAIEFNLLIHVKSKGEPAVTEDQA